MLYEKTRRFNWNYSFHKKQEARLKAFTRDALVDERIKLLNAYRLKITPNGNANIQSVF